MIKFKDVSANVLYKKEKSHNELLNLINATVSHEMRNPLNSISA
jgi:signal transduction histidine kinase